MRQAERREIDKTCGAHKLCSGSAPVSVPRITCNCGKTWTERGWPTERVPTAALARCLPWSASTHLDLGGLGAPKNEVAFPATSGANFCGYGSGAEFAGGKKLAQRPKGGPPQGAAALARALCEWVLEEGRARVREEECLRSTGWSGKVPGHT